jgi:hypothetical protein
MGIHDSYEGVACPVYLRLHFVSKIIGKLLGGRATGGDNSFVSCRLLDIGENRAQAECRSLWGLRVVGIWEAIPFQEFAPSFGGGQPYACTEVDEFSARRISFPAHSTILTESEPATAIYKLTRGTACLYKMLADGRRQIVGFALPGDFLGSPFVERYSCSVDAISEVAALRFSREPFLTFLRSHPKHLCLMLEAEPASRI